MWHWDDSEIVGQWDSETAVGLPADSFPPTDIYCRLIHMRRVPRFFTAFRMTESDGKEST